MGKFIVIEGIDASGKTTVARLVCEQLKAGGHSCAYASKREPTVDDPEIGRYLQLLGSIIWAKDGTKTPWPFLSANQWVQQLMLWYSVLSTVYIRPLLRTHDYVVTDGWFYKLFARFLLDPEVDKEALAAFFPSVDIASPVFLLSVDPGTCWKRRGGHFAPTEMASYRAEITDPYAEFVRFQGQVFGNLADMAKRYGWNILEAGGLGADEIAGEIVRATVCLPTL